MVLTRTLGLAGFGAWSLFIVTLSMTMTVSTMNCGSSLMRFLSGNRKPSEVNEAISTVFAMVSGVALIVGIALVCFSGVFVRRAFHSYQSGGILLAALIAALFFDSIFEEIKNLLRARRENRLWAYLCLTRLIPETLVVIAVAYVAESVAAAAWSYVAIAALSVAGGMVYLRARQGVRIVRPSRHIFLKYARYGLPLLPGVLASTLSLGADKYVVSCYLGLQEVGIYSVCFAISALVFFSTGAINDVLFPELSALHDQNDQQSFRNRFESVQKFVFGFGAGVAGLMAFFPHDILRTVASHDFAPGASTLAVLGVQGIFMAFILLYVVILNVHFRVWTTTVFWAVSGIAIVGFDVLLVPRIGIVGAAVGQLLATAGGAAILIAMHWKLFRQTFRPTWVLQISSASLGVYILAVVWHPAMATLLDSIARILAGGGVFLACLWVTRYMTLSDLRRLKKAMP
ncbi:MAG TPA: oligosaccharide flippase family protein [Candidatus Acidoferrales bacterium]|nr:oligosaccharide flippase family protein [Candidatus Acidoferrales bacterium]